MHEDAGVWKTTRPYWEAAARLVAQKGNSDEGKLTDLGRCDRNKVSRSSDLERSAGGSWLSGSANPRNMGMVCVALCSPS